MCVCVCGSSETFGHRGSKEVKNEEKGEREACWSLCLASGTLLPALRVVQQLKDKKERKKNNLQLESPFLRLERSLHARKGRAGYK